MAYGILNMHIMHIARLQHSVESCLRVFFVVVLDVGNIVCAHDQIVKYSVGVGRFEKPGVLVQIQDSRFKMSSHLMSSRTEMRSVFASLWHTSILNYE